MDERVDDAHLCITHVASGVVSAVITGYGSEAVARRITSCASSVCTRDGAYHAFHDWTGLTGYSSAARTVLTSWGREHPEARVSILFQSKLIAMGVSVAALVMPKLASYSDRATFEDARARAVEVARGRGSTPASR